MGGQIESNPSEDVAPTVKGPEVGFLGTVASEKLPKVNEKPTVAFIWAVTLAEKTTLVLAAIELDV